MVLPFFTMMPRRLAILLVFFLSLATATLLEAVVPTTGVDLLTESGPSDGACASGVCGKPPGCVTGNECECGGRRCVSFSKATSSSTQGGSTRLMTEHWPESDAPSSACSGGLCMRPPGCLTGNECECSGRLCTSFSQSSTASAQEQGDRLIPNNVPEDLAENVPEDAPESGEPSKSCTSGLCSKPPGCVTGNECECGGRICASIPKTYTTASTQKHSRTRVTAKLEFASTQEHGTRMTTEYNPESDTTNGSCKNGLCKPPGCVTGYECECHSPICASFPQSSSASSQEGSTRLITEHSPDSNSPNGECATGLCGRPPSCVTGNECECHSHNCVTFSHTSSASTQEGGTRMIKEQRPDSTNLNGGCKTGMCSKPPGCVTGNECVCRSRHCVTFPDTSSASTQEGNTRLSAEHGPESNEPDGECATGLCGKPPGCVTGNECECRLRHCVSFSESSSSSTQEPDSRLITEHKPKSKEPNGACATGLCGKPPGCVTGRECECHSRRCITFP